MTIPEAVQLVLQAAVLPDAAGRICMLEMGEPVRILYLAEQMVRLSGLTPYKDVPIVFTGLRPGEKLDEELTSDVEATMPTIVEKIRLVNTNELDADALAYGLARIDAVLPTGTDQDVRDAIRALVPEYSHSVRRSPITDVEVQLGKVVAENGHRRPSTRGIEAPLLGGVPHPIETRAPSINIAQAS